MNTAFPTTIAITLLLNLPGLNVKAVKAQETPLSQALRTPLEPSPAAATIDVALQPDGIVRGRVVKRDGTPLDGTRVILRQSDQISAALIADTKGEFNVKGLSPGVYRIETPRSMGSYRFWRPEDAPPSARAVALVVSQEPELRGQLGIFQPDLLSLGLGAAGVTLGVLALDQAYDAESRAKRAEARANNAVNATTPGGSELNPPTTPVSP